jgi:hypothetical protein
LPNSYLFDSTGTLVSIRGRNNTINKKKNENINLKSILIAVFVLIASTKSYSQISKAEIIATGLTCSMCSNAINKQLKK